MHSRWDLSLSQTIGVDNQLQGDTRFGFVLSGIKQLWVRWHRDPEQSVRTRSTPRQTLQSLEDYPETPSTSSYLRCSSFSKSWHLTNVRLRTAHI